jgi:hypothetical protein
MKVYRYRVPMDALLVQQDARTREWVIYLPKKIKRRMVSWPPAAVQAQKPSTKPSYRTRHKRKVRVRRAA